jgi:hypothetical protein
VLKSQSGLDKAGTTGKSGKAEKKKIPTKAFSNSLGQASGLPSFLPIFPSFPPFPSFPTFNLTPSLSSG